MYALTEDWIMVYGSTCGTCRRGPSEARLVLVAWSIPCGVATVLTRGTNWPFRLARLGLVAVLISFGFAIAFV